MAKMSARERRMRNGWERRKREAKQGKQRHTRRELMWLGHLGCVDMGHKGRVRHKKDPVVQKQIRALNAWAWVPGTDLQVAITHKHWQDAAYDLRPLRDGDGESHRALNHGAVDAPESSKHYGRGLDWEGHAQMSQSADDFLRKNFGG